ncbi:MAG TPA: TRAP transporter small permease subunit [Gammaproteobacteria bacterium]|nr:TRAP transporter small permease subunit [Gammaproteobacteria bacterium]
MVALVLLFLLNDYLIMWREWPGVLAFIDYQGWFGQGSATTSLQGIALTQGWLQFFGYIAAFVVVLGYVLLTRNRLLRTDADRLTALSAYVVRAAYWTVFLVGLADMLISFLRVEDFLSAWVGEQLTSDLGRTVYRGTYVHFPLIGLALIIALFTRSLGYVWLALLVVVAEFQIVITRFVFSYEQAFLGDLVRFWYAALFLFASANTLITGGHVRVDVFYTNFSVRRKAWVNLWGSVLLGMPLCWTILTMGMWTRGSSLNSPLYSFEISQSAYGMYVKYLMGAFLIVYAVSMLIQFSSYVLSSAADLRGEPGGDQREAMEQILLDPDVTVTIQD